MIPIPRRFWLLGIAAALAVHVAIAVAVYWQSPESGARDAGRGGIQVSLGPAGGSPGEAVEVDGTPEAETVDPEAADEQAVMEVEEALPAEPDSARVETVAPEAADEQAATEVEDAVPVELDASEVETVEPIDTTTATSLPEQQAQDVPQQPEPAEPAAEPEPEPETTEASAPSVAGAGGQAGDTETADVGSGDGDNAAGGGTPGASPDYMARLRAWLEQHKRYPRRARLRRQEGTAMLSFVIDRQGRVVEYSIRESSGHRILDEEVAAMIERAQPLPGFPDDLQRPRLKLVVPVQFFLM